MQATPAPAPDDGAVNALSCDVEDYFQVAAFDGVLSRQGWEHQPRRVDRNTHAVLDLFARCGVKGTFFTLGWVAERHPDLVRRMAAEGHEVASHGYDHAKVTTLTPEQRAKLTERMTKMRDRMRERMDGRHGWGERHGDRRGGGHGPRGPRGPDGPPPPRGG